jgi:hypothetical protein
VLRFHRGPFATGRSKFLDRASWHREQTAKIYVEILIDGLIETVYAQVDTGAAWSILSPDLARVAGIRVEEGDPAILSTRFGLQRGHIIRIPFSLVADEGESLDTEGTFFISPDWPPRQVFLGYSGLLDSIRFALDPQVNDFYFGPC